MATIRLSALDWVCFALLIIGALNWGVIGIAEINVVEAVIGAIFQETAAEIVTRTIYALVGIAGLYVFYPLYRVSQRTQSRARSSASD